MTTDHEAPPAKKGRGCLGCAGAIVVIIALCAAAWFLAPTVMTALGLSSPGAEELYSGAPDLFAGRAVEEVLVDSGVEGASVTVIPIKGSDGQLAVITLHDASSINWSESGSAEEGFLHTVQALSRANGQGLRVERAVIDVRGENGQPFIAITASQDSIDAYANGEISRDEFVASVDADLDSLLDLVDLQALGEGE